jgi:hypothetical protein
MHARKFYLVGMKHGAQKCGAEECGDGDWERHRDKCKKKFEKLAFMKVPTRSTKMPPVCSSLKNTGSTPMILMNFQIMT